MDLSQEQKDKMNEQIKALGVKFAERVEALQIKKGSAKWISCQIDFIVGASNVAFLLGDEVLGNALANRGFAFAQFGRNAFEVKEV